MSKEKVPDAMKAAGKPLKVGEMAEAAGLYKKAVYKAMKELKLLKHLPLSAKISVNISEK